MIGVGAGATFVNSVIAKDAFAVAGILTYGGTVDTGLTSSIPVPAYVHAADSRRPMYRAANGATRRATDSTVHHLHQSHPARGPPASGGQQAARPQETLAQAFENAWKTVFSRNYRLHMSATQPVAKASIQTTTPNPGNSPSRARPRTGDPRRSRDRGTPHGAVAA